MRVTIQPAKLHGTVAAIPSKACGHRALIAAALSEGPASLEGLGESDDIRATARCLRALAGSLGLSFADGETVHGLAEMAVDASKVVDLDCGESGSTLRFLVPVVAALGISAAFHGHGRLPARPIGLLLDQLAAHGVTVGERGVSPLRISGQLEAGLYTLPGNVSSQYVTGLLFALPLLDDDSEIRLESPLESAGYVELTIATLERFSIRIEETETGYRIPGGQSFVAPARVAIEGDWSAAAFWLAAGALGSNVSVRGLRLPSGQCDRAILSILPYFGANSNYDDGRASVFRQSLRRCTVDVSQNPDLMPVLSIVAATAQGTTRIVKAGRLRLKESDRLATMAEIVRGLGVDCEIEDDVLSIHGKGGLLRGGTFDARGDHRVAMALAIAATVADGPVTIEGAEAVTKSDPAFWETYDSLLLRPVVRDGCPTPTR